MPKTRAAPIRQRDRKMNPQEHARHAAMIRWAEQRAKHYGAVYQIRSRVITAESAIAALAAALPDEQREALDVALANLVGGFHELWKFSGQDLPIGLRDYAAGVLDELHRQAAVREVTPG